jgi:molecular chaperone GrpE
MSSESVNKNWKKVKEEFELEEAISSIDDIDNLDEVDESSMPSEQHLDDMKKLIDTLKLDNDKLKDMAMRATAEMQNIRRIADRDVDNARRFGVTKLLEALIPVLDSLEEATKFSTNESEGVQLTVKLFLDVLQKHDVVQLNPEGEIFDANSHEALAMQPVEGVPPNQIVSVIQKGYQLNGRVIRPARVIVAKALDA